MPRDRFLSEIEVASIPKRIEFAGQTYESDHGKALVLGTMLHSLPARNSAGRGWTAATIANSFRTAIGQGANHEHRLQYFSRLGVNAAHDEYRGAILACEFPEKTDAIAAEARGEAIPLKVLVAVWKKAKDAVGMLADIASGSAGWKLSMECEFEKGDICLWDGQKFYPWAECSAEMKALVHAHSVDAWNGKPVTLCLGGKDGVVEFTGVGFTRNPADQKAEIDHMAASDDVIDLASKAWDTEDAPDKFFAYVPAEAKGPDGKKSLRKFPLASVEKKGLDPAILRNALARFSQAKLPPSAKAGVRAKILSAIRSWNSDHPRQKIKVSETASDLVAGISEAREGHAHAILRDLTCLAAGDPSHTHYVRVLDVGPPLEGVLDRKVEWSEDGNSKEHDHVFLISGANGVSASSGGSVAGSTGKGGREMVPREIAAGLKSMAAALRAKEDPDNANRLDAFAVTLEQSETSQDIATAVDAKLKGGEYVAKADHDKALEAAKTAGRKELEMELAAKAEKDAKEKEVLEARIKQLKDSAGVDPTDELRVDLGALPEGEAGNKAFATMLKFAVANRLKAAANNGLAGDAAKGEAGAVSARGFVVG
jgi:hypothetical protein